MLARAAAKYGAGQVSCMNHKRQESYGEGFTEGEGVGYKGIMVTVDAPVVGKRERDKCVSVFLQVWKSSLLAVFFLHVSSSSSLSFMPFHIIVVLFDSFLGDNAGMFTHLLSEQGTCFN